MYFELDMLLYLKNCLMMMACNCRPIHHTMERLGNPTCILDVSIVYHAEVDKPTRGSQIHKQLLEVGVFFYNANYNIPPTK